MQHVIARCVRCTSGESPCNVVGDVGEKIVISSRAGMPPQPQQGPDSTGPSMWDMPSMSQGYGGGGKGKSRDHGMPLMVRPLAVLSAWSALSCIFREGFLRLSSWDRWNLDSAHQGLTRALWVKLCPGAECYALGAAQEIAPRNSLCLKYCILVHRCARNVSSRQQNSSVEASMRPLVWSCLQTGAMGREIWPQASAATCLGHNS